MSSDLPHRLGCHNLDKQCSFSRAQLPLTIHTTTPCSCSGCCAPFVLAVTVLWRLLHHERRAGRGIEGNRRRIGGQCRCNDEINFYQQPIVPLPGVNVCSGRWGDCTQCRLLLLVICKHAVNECCTFLCPVRYHHRCGIAAACAESGAACLGHVAAICTWISRQWFASLSSASIPCCWQGSGQPIQGLAKHQECYNKQKWPKLQLSTAEPLRPCREARPEGSELSSRGMS